MKTKLPYILIVAAIVLATSFSGYLVAIGETYLSVDAETGDVYRVRERSRAYCDGTVVTRFRARRVGSSCDRADAGGCAGNYGSQGSYGRGPRVFRGTRVHSFGSQGGYGSCDSADYGSCDQ